MENKRQKKTDVIILPDNFTLGKDKIWLLTDTHFNHTNIIKYEDRPDDFKKQIIRNCKKMIGPNDLLIHLGDVIFSRASELTGIMAQIDGYKILTRGNHDGNKREWYRSHGFDFVTDILIFGGIVFSHEPVDFLKMHGIVMNIHGHFHRAVRTEDDRSTRGYEFYSKDHAYLSIEEEEYKPILLEDFIDKKLNHLK